MVWWELDQHTDRDCGSVCTKRLLVPGERILYVQADIEWKWWNRQHSCVRASMLDQLKWHVPHPSRDAQKTSMKHEIIVLRCCSCCCCYGNGWSFSVSSYYSQIKTRSAQLIHQQHQWRATEGSDGAYLGGQPRMYSRDKIHQASLTYCTDNCMRLNCKLSGLITR